MLKYIAQFGCTQSNFATGLKHGVQILFAEPEILERQCGLMLASFSYRIGFGKQMPALAIAVDQIDNLKLFDDLRTNRTSESFSAGKRIARLARCSNSVNPRRTQKVA